MAAFEVTRMGRPGVPHWESSLKSTFITSRPSSNSVVSSSPSLPCQADFPRRVKSQGNGYVGVKQSPQFDPACRSRNNTGGHRGVRKTVGTRSSSLSRVSHRSLPNGIVDATIADQPPDKSDNIHLKGESVRNDAVDDNDATSSPRSMLPNVSGRPHFSAQSERHTYTRVKSNTYLARSGSHSSLPGLNISQLAPQPFGELSTSSSNATRSTSAEPAMLKSRDKKNPVDGGFRSKGEMLKALKKKLGTADELNSTHKRPYSVRKQSKPRSAQSLHQQWESEGITNPYMERPQSRIVRKSPGLRGMFLRPQDSSAWISPARRICPPDCDCCFKVALQPEKLRNSGAQSDKADAGGSKHAHSPQSSDEETKKARKVKFSV
ncbi:uncharacterized protein LOC144344187 [Saccoglossus kowalevskii]